MNCGTTICGTTWEPRAVRLAREAGALAMLPLALATRAGNHVFAGEFDAAAALIEEADTIAAATGYAPVRYHAISLSVWRGAEAEAMRLLEATTELAASRGEGRVVGLVGCMTAILNNGLGHYEDALRAAKQACEHEDLGPYRMSLAELIEARRPLRRARGGARGGRADGNAGGRRNGLGARHPGALPSPGRRRHDCGGLLPRGDRSARAHQNARLSRALASRLRRVAAPRCTGEWMPANIWALAHEMFVQMGSESFAERARRELLVTGEKTQKRPVGSGDGLTAQEAQIARWPGAGLTNQEIGAQLFISAHTVEWHLRKVFAKLGIKSRRQLAAGSSEAT